MYENLWLDELWTTEQRENMALALSREGVREGSKGVWSRGPDVQIRLEPNLIGIPPQMAIWIVIQK